MPANYFKRYRLVCDLTRSTIVVPELPVGYAWIPWEPTVLERHAVAKCEAFREEVDAVVFECLGELTGCRRLMRDIAQQAGFCPDATWLVGREHPRTGDVEDCGTIQGVTVSATSGSIQNVGITPPHRGRGLGRALVLRSLAGFQAHGIRRVTLEVTAQNTTAVQLYRSLGFRNLRTMFREAALVDV